MVVDGGEDGGECYGGVGTLGGLLDEAESFDSRAVCVHLVWLEVAVRENVGEDGAVQVESEGEGDLHGDWHDGTERKVQ